ncbi:MAG: hypothetical protein Q8O55_06980, partial [Dehalococcoidales bacterium]|nr:hypothetical protein [Dehalococcoidales bacterium]
ELGLKTTTCSELVHSDLSERVEASRNEFAHFVVVPVMVPVMSPELSPELTQWNQDRLTAHRERHLYRAKCKLVQNVQRKRFLK